VTILVTGDTGQGTGNVGRHVFTELVRAGAAPRVLTRNPAAANLPGGTDVVYGDLSKPDTLGPAFEGIERMYMMAINGDNVLDPETATSVFETAKGAGIRRVVLLSASGTPLIEVEVPLEESGLEWTHVRPGEYSANTVDLWASAIRGEGVVRGAFLDVIGVPIHEADVADVAVAALLEDGHTGQAYSLTGPEQLTQRQQVRAIGAAIGRDLRTEDLTWEAARRGMQEEGWPEDIINHLFGYYTTWADDPPEVLPTVRDITGRPGRSFAQWATEHTADFA